MMNSLEPRDFVSIEKLPEFTSAADLPIFNEHGYFDSVENLELAEIQDNVIIETISGVQSSPIIISPSVTVDINASLKEPKKLIEALEEEGWIIAMQEEHNQFERNKV
ncbi:hypothetical protein Tco_0817809 [Tanacetum coccineum]